MIPPATACFGSPLRSAGPSRSGVSSLAPMRGRSRRRRWARPMP